MGKKASELVKYYNNGNGPVIGTVHRNVLYQEGLYFKDIDGSGVMKAVCWTKHLWLKEKISLPVRTCLVQQMP